MSCLWICHHQFVLSICLCQDVQCSLTLITKNTKFTTEFMIAACWINWSLFQIWRVSQLKIQLYCQLHQPCRWFFITGWIRFIRFWVTFFQCFFFLDPWFDIQKHFLFLLHSSNICYIAMFPFLPSTFPNVLCGVSLPECS